MAKEWIVCKILTSFVNGLLIYLEFSTELTYDVIIAGSIAQHLQELSPIVSVCRKVRG